MSETTTSKASAAAAPPGLWARVCAGEAGGFRTLAARFWYPPYVWLRANGFTAAEAARHCTSFLTRLGGAVPPAREEPAAARFREYVLAQIKEHLIAGCPAAEGGEVISVDEEEAEKRFAEEPAKPEDELFARRWSLRILELAMGALKTEHDAAGKAELYEAMKPFLGFNASEAGYSEAGRSTGMSGSAFHLQVFSFRKRYRAMLREQIADTVRHQDDVDSELTVLLVGAS